MLLDKASGQESQRHSRKQELGLSEKYNLRAPGPTDAGRYQPEYTITREDSHRQEGSCDMTSSTASPVIGMSAGWHNFTIEAEIADLRVKGKFLRTREAPKVTASPNAIQPLPSQV